MPTSQSEHTGTFDAVEYLPAPHLVHKLAPAVAPVFVIDPAAHSTQSLAPSEPLVSTYFPASQSVHAVMLEAVEYFPAGHKSHAVAPASTPVFVIDPAIQSVHDATLDTFENFPATHFVHVVAPALLPVIEPAAHTLQNTAAPELWYMPALHSSHEGRLEADCM